MDTTQHPPSSERIISVRKLVALDIVFHGSRFIVAEFALGVALAAALGLWIISSAFPLSRAGAPFKLLVGAYFVCMAINYVPMLCYAIAISRRQSARHEVAAELGEKGRFPHRYGIQQLLLVVPLVIPTIAILQERKKSHVYV